jgi:hypothetical protein
MAVSPVSHLPEAPFPAAAALRTERLATPHCPALQTRNSTSASQSPLENPDELLQHVPGEPTVTLTPSEVHDFLLRELETPILDEIYPRLWLVARKSGMNIDPLHRQTIKGRDIVPAEDPKLHLIRHHNKIYLKPMPICLLNHHFWTLYLAPSRGKASSCTNLVNAGEKHSSPKFDRSVAVGFLRSYAFLIQHRLDLILAQEHHLIPSDIDWIKWSKFIDHFRHIEDEQVAKRYHYGQLRLSRLNWVNRIFRPRNRTTSWFYEVPHWSTGIYIERAIAPLLFIFASLSLVLSSMQVVLAVPADGLGFAELDGFGLQAMRRAFWIFSITLLFFSGAIWILLLAVPASVIWWQLSWGFRNRGKALAGRTAEA